MPTKIEWVQNPDGSKGHTWNPIVGCSKISPGCANCYAEKMAFRLKAMGHQQYQDVVDENGWTGKVKYVPGSLKRVNRKKPTMYFVCSMADLFHEAVSDSDIYKVFAFMAHNPQHIFQILTKRPKRMAELVPKIRDIAPDKLNHVWYGVTAENQQTADERIPILLQTPAAVRFVSVEPCLEAMDIVRFIGHRTFKCECGFHDTEMELVYMGGDCRLYSCVKCGKTCQILPAVNWVIVGCESGPKRRPCKLEWVRSIVEQCKETGIPCFVKQIEINGKVSKDMNEWPEDLRVRQMPEVAR
jgi:protein gp37